MAEAIRQIYQLVKQIPTQIDTRTDTYFLSNNFIPIIIIITAYLGFVLKFGNDFMRNRQSFDLNKVTIMYNIAQVGVNVWLVIKATKVMSNSSVICTEIDWSNSDAAFESLDLHYLYFAIKTLDLFDTVIMVLRKKSNQVSFLHVYHHSGIAFGSFISFKFFSGGQLLYLGYINSIVHIVMYAYYLLTALDSSYRDSLWWKKYLTQFQILQHLVLTVMFFFVLINPSCSFPKIVAMLVFVQGIFFIILFSHFYYQTYCIKIEKRKNTKNE